MYIKDSEISDCKHIILNDLLIFNPTDEQIAEAGWKEYTHGDTTLTVEEQNEKIRITRQLEYQRRSDSMYMAYIKYLAQSEMETDETKKNELLEKAATMKENWLKEVEAINQEIPYIENE